jgi:hypothetical protein
MPATGRRIRLRGRTTHRLIASRYPSVGILDRVASPDDLDAIFELEGWTNDRISAEVGILQRLPREEWIVGEPMASVVMAAFCHPLPGGGRFNDGTRGAWYSAFTLSTAHAEVAYHRGRELAEVGISDARLELREYLADFTGEFVDIRGPGRARASLYHPDRYDAPQRFALELLAGRANGIVYDSVRHPGGTCLVAFRPALVRNVRVGGHFEYRWSGGPTPAIHRLPISTS